MYIKKSLCDKCWAFCVYKGALAGMAKSLEETWSTQHKASQEIKRQNASAQLGAHGHNNSALGTYLGVPKCLAYVLVWESLCVISGWGNKYGSKGALKPVFHYWWKHTSITELSACCFLSPHLNPPSFTEMLAEPRAFPNHTWSWGQVHLLMSFFPSPFGFRELRFNFTKPILQACCHSMARCASAY